MRLSTNCRAQSNVDVIAIGHGKTSDKSDVSAHLKYTHLKLIPLKDCEQLYPDKISSGSYICARSSVDDYQSVCGGDSGGPLLTKFDHTLIGIASFVTRCKIHLSKFYYNNYTFLFVLIFKFCSNSLLVTK